MPVVRKHLTDHSSTVRMDMAERQNKMASERFTQNLNSLDKMRIQQMAARNIQKKLLHRELTQLHTDVTPSLECLTVEFPPDLPQQYLALKRHSLPAICGISSLAISPNSGPRFTRRNSVAPCPDDFQKRMNEFVTQFATLNGYVSQESLSSDRSLSDQEQEGDTGTVTQNTILDRQMGVSKMASCEAGRLMSVEEEFEQVKTCRYIRYGVCPEFERELTLKEIFQKEDCEKTNGKDGKKSPPPN